MDLIENGVELQITNVNEENDDQQVDSAVAPLQIHPTQKSPQRSLSL